MRSLTKSDQKHLRKAKSTLSNALPRNHLSDKRFLTDKEKKNHMGFVNQNEKGECKLFKKSFNPALTRELTQL